MTAIVNEDTSTVPRLQEPLVLSESQFSEFSNLIDLPLPSTEKLEALASAPSPFRREVSTEDVITLAHNSGKAPRFPASL